MIDTPMLVDQYCHGVLRTELGLGTFEARLGQGAAPGTTLFDTQTGFAVRRWCPPLLGLEPHCPPARYLARRRELGVLEAGRRLLRGSGITTYLVSSGLPDDLTGPEEMAAAGDAEAREVVRLEPLAAQVADTSGTVVSFLANLAESVHGAATHAVAFAATAPLADGGPALAPEPPGPAAVRAAVARWLAGRRVGVEPTDPVLLGHLLWTAVATGRPLQLHAGPEDPAPLTGFVRATAGLGTDLVLLPGHFHHRHAARLAAAHPHVYADSGAALARTGARAATVLADILELAPFGKILFSTGAQSLPELHVVGAHLFREALNRVLGTWVTEGAWSATDARRVAHLLAADNAHRVYGLR
ncbi:amidohydrolase [Streptomyces sp. NPDC002176]|uniref:amidohydrolase n=1 Tax=Streptomyces sp. NPDC002176 TaxID=3364634 RepID=UPI0038503DB0